MPYDDRIDVTEGIDANKTTASKESLKYSFNFQPNVCNRCHDLFMMSINLSDIVVLNIKGSDHRCIISLIGKNEAIKLLTNADLTEKSEKLQKKWKIAN